MYCNVRLQHIRVHHNTAIKEERGIFLFPSSPIYHYLPQDFHTRRFDWSLKLETRTSNQISMQREKLLLWKHGSILVCINSSGCWWWNAVRDIFLANFGLLHLDWASFKHHSLPEYCYWPLAPLWPQCRHLLTAPSCVTHHVTKAQIISNLLLEHVNEFTVFNSELLHLWDVVEWDLHYGCRANKSASAVMTVWTEISKYCFQHLVESVPRRTKNFWGQTSATKAYLIKFHMHTFIRHLDTHTHAHFLSTCTLFAFFPAACLALTLPYICFTKQSAK